MRHDVPDVVVGLDSDAAASRRCWICGRGSDLSSVCIDCRGDDPADGVAPPCRCGRPADAGHDTCGPCYRLQLDARVEAYHRRHPEIMQRVDRELARRRGARVRRMVQLAGDVERARGKR